MRLRCPPTFVPPTFGPCPPARDGGQLLGRKRSQRVDEFRLGDHDDGRGGLVGEGQPGGMRHSVAEQFRHLDQFEIGDPVERQFGVEQPLSDLFGRRRIGDMEIREHRKTSSRTTPRP
jgi:hypothetical protein